jgi:hypothetical protein
MLGIWGLDALWCLSVPSWTAHETTPRGLLAVALLATLILSRRPLFALGVSRWSLSAFIIPGWSLPTLILRGLIPPLLIALLSTILARARLVLVLALLAALVASALPVCRWSALFLTRAPTTFGNLLLPQFVLRRPDPTICRPVRTTTPTTTVVGGVSSRRSIGIGPIGVGPGIAGFWPGSRLRLLLRSLLLRVGIRGTAPTATSIPTAISFGWAFAGTFTRGSVCLLFLVVVQTSCLLRECDRQRSTPPLRRTSACVGRSWYCLPYVGRSPAPGSYLGC